MPDTATGWVGGGCADYEETIDLNPESAAHTACDGNRDNNDSGDPCWNQANYESGTENVTVAE